MITAAEDWHIATNELVVFMASPSDVPEEREAIRRVGESLNAALRQVVPIRVVIVGWEQSRPAFGRPQASINPMVEGCDLFVGILNRRWGSETGVYSSGFEEEFELALGLRQAAPAPEIFMYFHELSQDMLDDPGSELQKVLAFKERVRTDKLLLYRTYRSAEDLELQVHQHLLTYVLERAQLDIGRGESSPRSGRPIAETVTDADAESIDEAGAQLIEVFDAYRALLSRERKDGAAPLDSSRLLLFAEAFAKDAPELDGHLANRLYGKADLVLTRGEHQHWLRSLLLDAGSAEYTGRSRSVPGWKHLWLVDAHDAAALFDAVADLTSDTDLRIARGALTVLREARARPPALWDGPVDEPAELLTDAPGRTPGAKAMHADGGGRAARWSSLLRSSLLPTALQYLYAVATPADTRIFEELASALGGDANAVIAAVAALQIGDLNPLADLVKISGIRGSWLAATLLSRVAELNDESLNALIAGRWDASVSAAALDALLSRSELALSEEALDRVLASDDDDMLRILFARLGRSTALDQLVVGRVTNLPDKNDRRDELVRRAAYVVVGVDDGQIDPPSLDNVDAWEALSWEAPAGYDALARAILDAHSFMWNSELDHKYEVVRRFLEGRLRVAAARYLVAFASGSTDPADVARIRTALQQHSELTVRPLARIFAPIAEPQDVELMASMADELYGSDARMVLGRAVALGGLATARMFVEAGDEKAVAGASYLAANRDATVDELIDLLFHDNAAVRIAAANGLVRNVGREQLEAIHDDYPALRATYFYNVVVAFDSALYGPAAPQRPADS